MNSGVMFKCVVNSIVYGGLFGSSSAQVVPENASRNRPLGSGRQIQKPKRRHKNHNKLLRGKRKNTPILQDASEP